MSLSFLSAVRRFPLFLPSAKLAAAALVAVVMAAPVWAQTITAPGLIGPTACVGKGDSVDTINFGTISAVANNNATFSAPRVVNVYGILRSQGGDGGPTEFPTNIKVHNARTGAQAGTTQVLAIFRQVYTQLNTDFTFTLSGLTANTPYYVVVYTTATGFGENRPFTTRCFMTGGTYTPTNTAFPGSTGCFSISPRTPQDVRNCLCGRGNTGTVGTQNYDYTSLRSAWGCAN